MIRILTLLIVMFISGIQFTACKKEENFNLRKLMETHSGYKANNVLLFGEGWYGQEPNGRWTKDTLSKIILFTANENVSRLAINGHYFPAIPKPSSISINGKNLGNIDFVPSQKNHTWTFNVPKDLIKANKSNHIEIRSQTPIMSPKELGSSQDDRKFRFTLNRIIVN